MAALDTNVLVRFLVRDHLVQLASATRLISPAIQAGEVLFVPITVALELEWVLRSNFGFSKTTVTHAIAQLLSSTELVFESESALEIALVLYAQSGADFSDCLHVALTRQAGKGPLWTFDKAASRVEGARWANAA